MVHNLKAGILTHCLYLTDDFTHKAFLEKLWCQVGIQHNCYPMVAVGYISLHLGRFNKQIILFQCLGLNV